MRSVLWSFIVLLGSCMLQPALLDRHELNGRRMEHWRQEEHLRDSVDRWQEVTPVRTSETGEPYPQHQQHILHSDKAQQSQPLYYLITAFGTQLHVSLNITTQFVSPQLRFRHVGENKTWLATDDIGMHCFRNGIVDGDPESIVSLSVCHSLMGSIYAFNKHYLIRGMVNNVTVLSANTHIIYQLQNGRHFSDQANSTNTDSHKQEETQTKTQGLHKNTIFKYLFKHHRNKRSISMERFVEVMVVADSNMAKYHGKDLQRYILTLMSIVSSIYRHPSIGNSINIVVVKVVVLESRQDGPRISSNAASTLRNFCQWQHAENEGDDSSPHHHDTAILLTRQDICRSSRKCDTLGLAELGTMCDAKRSCSIIEDNGLSAAFTIAHELGHVFSLPHDDDKLKCKHHLEVGSGATLHVMSPTLDYSTNPWSWSTCSTNILTNFLDSGHGECLLDHPTAEHYEPSLVMHDDRPPGQLYDINMQCDQVFGRGSKVCPYMPVCKRLWCTNPANSLNNGCRTQHMPWADGSTCAPNKVCEHGKCVSPSHVIAVDGDWGRWQAYGKCSRSCGGGIKQAYRLCDNPVPRHGGHYCIGQRVKYKSCNIRNCPESSMTFRDVQCAEFNGKHFNINGLPPTVKWVPKYSGIAEHERCKLFCQVEKSSAYYLLRDKVLDGTKCSAHADDICVQGKCQKAGCDNQLGSSVRRDKCGVCGGDSSTCKTIFRTFNEVRYGYNVVVRLPRGATNIDIQQRGHHNLKKDDNYLALRNSAGEYLLNGNFVVSMFRKEMNMKGTLIEYSGSDNVIERINSTNSLQEDIELLVLTVGELHPPDITYTYTISQRSPDKYIWSRKKGAWSRCDKPCQGYKRRKVVCVNAKDRSLAAESKCRHVRKPKEIKKRCHMQCSVRWQIVEQSECSVQCGNGVLTRKIRCLKIKRHRPKYVKDRHCSQLDRKPRATVHCQGLCLHAHWQYSRWSRCSKTCGGGSKYREARCVNSHNITVDEHQCHHRRPTTRRCKKNPCTKWQLGEWSQCMGSCGDSYRERQLWCRRGNSVVSKSQCRHTKTPKTKEPCQLKSCPVWYTGFWARCSTTCGEGVKRRPVICRYSTTHQVVHDYECRAIEKPADQMACHNPLPCEQDKQDKKDTKTSSIKGRNWRVGSWTQCSRTCGTGNRERYVSCRDRYGKIADDRECRHIMKPESIESCLEKPCGYWRTGKWTGCSVTCGEGVDTRLVACITMEELEEWEEQKTNPSECDMAVKPASHKMCNMQGCAQHNDYNIASIASNRVVGAAHWRVGTWGQCSVSCGGSGWQRRRVLCQDENGPSNKCDTTNKPTEMEHCGSEPCPSWTYGEWGQCSVSCGSGEQKRVVICRNQNSDTMPDNRCDSVDKPASIQTCVAPAICTRHHGSSHRISYDDRGRRITKWRSWSSWSTSEWSQYPALRARTPVSQTKKTQLPRATTRCSTSCGAGHKTRQVKCVDSDGKKQHDSLCVRHSRQPRSIRRCRHGHCPHWKTFPWQLCSVTCGVGVRQRDVQCIGAQGIIDSSFCGHIPKPVWTEPCHVKDCTLFQWRIGIWSECSITCGRGQKRRETFCVNSETEQKVSSYHCSDVDKPKSIDVCQQQVCQSEWVVQEWSECSTSCGARGQQTRVVSCKEFTKEGRPITTNSRTCDNSTRPSPIRQCHQRDCHKRFHWRTTRWGKCLQDCGHSISEREVFCYDIVTQMIMNNSKKCIASYKPETTQPCYRRPCYASSCQELRMMSLLENDDEYSLYIRGQFIKVYCKNMRSQPQEYITLPAGESENFSEIYDRRLRLPDSCPNNGTRMSPCRECTGKAYRRAGITSFSKVKINITSLQVILNDFKFSSTSGAKQIPFATAGDCYSTQDCPLGMFRVNLSGTKLMMATTATWKNSGYKVSQEITVSEMQQVIDGKCGGYCGRCSPANSVLQLQLLP